MPFPCRAHAVPLPCRAAKCLESVIPFRFTQCGRVWFKLAMPRPYHALTMPFFSRPQHSTSVKRRPCCAVALRRTAWSENGIASVNQTRPQCVNQMGKTHSKPLAARHGRDMGTACYVWIGPYPDMVEGEFWCAPRAVNYRFTFIRNYTNRTSVITYDTQDLTGRYFTPAFQEFAAVMC